MPTKDNRDYVDSKSAPGAEGCAQKLSQEDIQKMKSSGKCTSEQIIQALVESSGTYGQKTGFSQQKYLKRKFKKYMTRVQIFRPTGFNVAETCFERSCSKVCNMREDAMAQILTYANVHAHQQILVHETCMGTVVGAIAERMGGYGRQMVGYDGQQACIEASSRYNMSKEVESAIVPFPLTWLPLLKRTEEAISADKEAVLHTSYSTKVVVDAPRLTEEQAKKNEEERGKKFTKAQQEKHLARKAAREARREARPKDYQVRGWLREGSDSIIIASRFDPTSMLMNLWPYLKPSKPFVVFCEYLEVSLAGLEYIAAILLSSH
jgi:tRNA (adenine-N(1)-)-methyltransferase non-catalytic subunit